ncbi:unnamed protein product [Durusdinium trenchii]|uniref:Helicase-associated domain-containing protein n=1 Tax=Durusdinium trenchii TaxID=1381693 RepID=A0ABP0N393_9DINO
MVKFGDFLNSGTAKENVDPLRRWAGFGRFTGAWSLLSRPFWWQDLCVGIVNSVTRSNREVKGSNFLKDAAVGSRLQCSLEKGTLQLPPLEVPLILICPGTGLSPCRALVQERHKQLMGAKSPPARFHKGLQDLMFLGFRHQDGDFLYGHEWSNFKTWLSVHVAFSRDHEDKKAETSITIDDVTHVIDSCHVKETRFSPQSSTSVFSTVWVSQAAAKQRAGRAGRTRPGVCWRLCRQDFMEKELPKHTLCEMQRTPLEELVLQLRLLELGDHPGDFLRRAPEPPALEAVERAIRALVAIGALENDSQLRLTPLGFHLAHMPVDARIGKMLVYGSLCKCLAPILTIAACLSQRSPFIRNFNRTKEELQVQERRNVWGELHSDQLAAAKAYDKYHEQRRQGRENAWAVCDRFGLSSSTLDDVAQLRQQFLRHLAETGFADAEAGEDGGDQVNVHQSNLSLVILG